MAATAGITPQFFKTMEIPVLAGRVFDPTNAADRDTAVLSAAAAEALWPGRSPLGQWVHEGADALPRQVIGVVADIAAFRLDRPNEPALYRPLTTDQLAGPVTIVARSRVGADELVSGTARREGVAAGHAARRVRPLARSLGN